MDWIKTFEMFIKDEGECDECELIVDEDDVDDEDESPEIEEMPDAETIGLGKGKKNLVGKSVERGRQNLSIMPQTNYP